MNGSQHLSEAVRALLLMSAAGTGATLLVLLLRPLIRDRLPQRAQYRLWVLALAAFLIPFFSWISLPFPTPMTPLQAALESQSLTASPGGSAPAPGGYQAPGAPASPAAAAPAASALPRLALLVLAVGGGRLAASAAAYALYAAKLRQRRQPPRPQERAQLQALCQGRRGPRLYRCPLATTPMVLGLFRPIIYLPMEGYSPDQSEAILRHEFTHWRRKDVAVKWICALVLALHWFNPAAYLLRRQLSRACELACDEAAIQHLDGPSRQRYGDTLIALAAAPAPRYSLASTALWTEKRALKERLGAIMRVKAPGRPAVLLSWALPGLLFCAVALLSATGAARPSPLEGIAPYPLNQDQQDVLSYLDLDGSARLFSYAAPPEASSLWVNVYTLEEGRWQPTGGGAVFLDSSASQADETLQGVLALTLEEGQVAGFRIVSQDGASSYTCPALPLDQPALAYAACFLDSHASAQLEQEIPVALLVAHSGFAIPDFSLQSFFDPSPLSAMDQVQGVTLTFSRRSA